MSGETTISLAIETSCRAGGLALGRGEQLLKVAAFDASARHATQLIVRLDELLKAAALLPRDLQEVYVSAGPGSFTGLRVGITVARTLAQAVPGLRCLPVPTALAVADSARDLDFRHLGVVFDAREGLLYAALFRRAGREIVEAQEPQVTTPADFLAAAPRPLLLIGEGLGYHEMRGRDVQLADPALHLPTAEGVWRVGCRLARAGLFVEYSRLLPIYTRPPAALRLWDRKNP